MTKSFEPPEIDDLDDLVNGARDRFGGGDARTTAPEPEGPAAGPAPGDGVPSQRQNGTPSQRQSKFTVLLDAEDAATFDELALTLRRRLGRRVGKGDIVRALIRLAVYPASVYLQNDLIDRLTYQRDR